MGLDLSDPGVLLREDVVADPYPLYDLLRRDAPVWRVPGQDSYLVADPALIRDVVARPDEFSSNLVSLLHRDGLSGGLVAFDLTPYGDPVNTLATADPPVHTRHRRLLQPHLSPSALSGLEPKIASIVDEQLSPMLAARRGDFVTDFSDPVPALVICAVLGLPSGDAPRLVTEVASIGAMLDGVTDLDGMSEAAAAALDLLAYAEENVRAERQRPAGDRAGLLAVLVEAVDSQDITVEEAANLLVLLINAGTETTSSLLATAVRALAENGDLQRELRSHPASIPNAVEALLRDDGPFQFHYRWTPSDTTLGGVRIPAKSRVLLMWAAANRPLPDNRPDPSSGSEPPDRSPHYAFGRGIHFCIGAHLARLEVRIALRRLLAVTSSFSLEPDHPPIRRPSIFLRRHLSLPVVVRAS
jgi:cytochrome P450